jgi:hypothetical protein
MACFDHLPPLCLEVVGERLVSLFSERSARPAAAACAASLALVGDERFFKLSWRLYDTVVDPGCSSNSSSSRALGLCPVRAPVRRIVRALRVGRGVKTICQYTVMAEYRLSVEDLVGLPCHLLPFPHHGIDPLQMRFYDLVDVLQVVLSKVTFDPQEAPCSKKTHL